MRFTCTIDMNNAAFEDRPETELAECLVRINRSVTILGADRPCAGKVRDTNGNSVGEWRISE